VLTYIGFFILDCFSGKGLVQDSAVTLPRYGFWLLIPSTLGVDIAEYTVEVKWQLGLED
jgi:hypothetical protein